MIRKVKANIIQYRGLCCDKINTPVTGSSADAEKPARRDIIRREEKYRQLVGRRTGRSFVQHRHCSALSDRKFLSPPK